MSDWSLPSDLGKKSKFQDLDLPTIQEPEEKHIDPYHPILRPYVTNYEFFEWFWQSLPF